MTPEITTIPAQAATHYQHTLMTAAAFDKIVERAYDGGQAHYMNLWSDFYELEYLNSPCGLIVFAFHDYNGLETFYPASFDFKERTGITPGNDEIVPATKIEEPKFMRHSMGRKINGFVVRGAFGEMVQQDDPRAVQMSRDFKRLDVFDSPMGLIVAAHEGRRRYVIHSVELNELQSDMQKRAA